MINQFMHVPSKFFRKKTDRGTLHRLRSPFSDLRPCGRTLIWSSFIVSKHLKVISILRLCFYEVGSFTSTSRFQAELASGLICEQLRPFSGGGFDPSAFSLLIPFEDEGDGSPVTPFPFPEILDFFLLCLATSPYLP